MSIETTGKTIEEAVAAACTQLDATEDQVSVEVIDYPKAGFLGIGGTAAKVRVARITVEPEKAAPPKPVAPRPATKPKPAVPVAAAAAQPAAQPEEKPHARHFHQRKEADSPPNAEFIAEAVEVVTDLLTRMDFSPTVAAHTEENTLCLDVVGEGLGRLIGRRGETLDAVQRICSGILNRDKDVYTRIYIDSEGYRKKREELLVSLAHRSAERALRTGSNVLMEPMNSYARRVVHTVLQGYDKLSTHSVGSDPMRRVVITVK